MASTTEHETRVDCAFALNGWVVFCSCGKLTGFADTPGGADEIAAAHKAKAATTAVYVDDGCGSDSTGDDVREWYVTPGDDDGEPTGPSTTFGSFDAAFAAAEATAATFVPPIEVVA